VNKMVGKWGAGGERGRGLGGGVKAEGVKMRKDGEKAVIQNEVSTRVG